MNTSGTRVLCPCHVRGQQSARAHIRTGTGLTPALGPRRGRPGSLFPQLRRDWRRGMRGSTHLVADYPVPVCRCPPATDSRHHLLAPFCGSFHRLLGTVVSAVAALSSAVLTQAIPSPCTLVGPYGIEIGVLDEGEGGREGGGRRGEGGRGNSGGEGRGGEGGGACFCIVLAVSKWRASCTRAGVAADGQAAGHLARACLLRRRRCGVHPARRGAHSPWLAVPAVTL